MIPLRLVAAPIRSVMAERHPGKVRLQEGRLIIPDRPEQGKTEIVQIQEMMHVFQRLRFYRTVGIFERVVGTRDPKVPCYLVSWVG